MARRSEKAFEKDASKRDITDLIDDLFGLNIAGFRSLYTLIRRPRLYFKAAESANWLDRYTPSIRLWLSFFALMSLLRFIWLSETGPLVEIFTQGLIRDGIAAPADMSLREVSVIMASWTFAIAPIIQLILMTIWAISYNGWTRKTPVVLRVRLMFAVNVPSAALVPVMTVIAVALPPSWFIPFMLLMSLFTFTADWLTAKRGGFANASSFGGAVRATILAVGLYVIGLASSLLAQVIAIVAVSLNLGLGPTA